MQVMRIAMALVSLAQGDPSAPAWSNPFFHGDAIDYWGDGPTLGRRPVLKQEEDPARAPASEEARRSLWAEPVRLPDGKVSIYVPPKPVLEFLEAPTRENAEAYLAWQKERMAKLNAAVAVLQELQVERNKGAGPSEGRTDARSTSREKVASDSRKEGPPRGETRDPALAAEILYFKKPGCPWCAREDRELAAIAKSHPGVKVRTVSPEESPDLWKGYGVTVVPSMVVAGADGRQFMLRGYTSAEDLVRILTEVNRVEK